MVIVSFLAPCPDFLNADEQLELSFRDLIVPTWPTRRAYSFKEQIKTVLLPFLLPNSLVWAGINGESDAARTPLLQKFQDLRGLAGTGRDG